MWISEIIKYHQPLEAVAHHANIKNIKDAPTLKNTTREEKKWGPLSTDTNPNIRHPLFTTDGYDSNFQKLKTPTWATTVPQQEERKPTDTPAIEQLDQTPNLAILQTVVKSNSHPHQKKTPQALPPPSHKKSPRRPQKNHSSRQTKPRTLPQQANQSKASPAGQASRTERRATLVPQRQRPPVV